MGNTRHLALEEISALADGELATDALRAGREHLSECPSCRGVYQTFQQFDLALRQPPAMSCDAALPILSARLDGEADEAEATLAQAHLGTCTDCRAKMGSFMILGAMLRALPSGAPSSRVDRAIAQLGRAPRTSRVPAFAARGLVASLGAVLLILAGFSRSFAPTALPAAERTDALVASVQQVVLNSRTNTLYVLDSKAAAVDARDASTNEFKVRIDVGGRPTALALNESANTVLVLDASRKTVTEIDGASNKVISSNTFAVSGTPTSISVDPSTSKIVVTSTAATTTTTTTGATTNGSLTVLDGTTKKVDTVRDLSVAAEVMIFDSTGTRAALVSPASTTLIDASYKAVSTLPGGVSAAFAQGGGDRIAVLAAKGGGTTVTFGGRGAPIDLDLPGTPRAITALPDGGFLVLVDLGGKSRVSYVAPDGHEAASTDIAIAGEDLSYDGATKRFSVAGHAGVASAAVPTTLVATASTAPASASPSPVPTTSSSPAPTASANPSASPSPSAGTVAAASPTANPLALAATAGPSFVHVDLPGGRQPMFVAKSGERLWVLDDRNNVVTLDMTTAETFTVNTLPRGTQVSFWVAGRGYTYALDASTGLLHVVNATTQVVRSYEMNFLRPVSSIAVGIDDRLWIGLKGAQYLLAFDPETRKMASYDLGLARISELTIDAQGRILYADDARGAVGAYDPRTARLNEVFFPHRGTTTGLVVDGTSTLWLSTSAGEIFWVRGGVATLALGLQRPVTTLALDSAGRVWFLAPLPAGAVGFGYAAADSGQGAQTISGPASSLAFNALGRAWLADPRGGFYVSDK